MTSAVAGHLRSAAKPRTRCSSSLSAFLLPALTRNWYRYSFLRRGTGASAGPLTCNILGAGVCPWSLAPNGAGGGASTVPSSALMRIATLELGWRPDVPTSVVISEAVELAKAYSTEDSSGFVNGILATIAHELRPDEDKLGVRP